MIFVLKIKLGYFTTIDLEKIANCCIRATVDIETHYVLDLISTPGFN